MANNPNDTASFLDKQVEAYKAIRDIYQVFARVLEMILSRAVKNMGISAIVEARAKEIPSFAEKCIRKLHEYPDPVNQFPDLCGARVITAFKNDIKPVCEFIRKHFEIDEAKSEDTLTRLGASEFGYQSTHFVVSLKPQELKDLLHGFKKPEEVKNLFENLESDRFKDLRDSLRTVEAGTLKEILKAADKRLLEVLCQRCSENESRAAKLPLGPKVKAEIQVRTLLQHAWAVFDHDRFYKKEFEVPWRWQRDANRIAATLEEADEDFVRTIKGIDEYRTYYGAYMSRQEREEELLRLLAVLKYDKTNIHLTHRIARIAMSLEDWQKARDVLKKFVTKWDNLPKAEKLKKTAKGILQEKDKDKLGELQKELDELRDSQASQVLMDYGWSLWKTADKKGRDYIGWAVGLDTSNVNAYIFCAETYCDEHDNDRALEEYEKAFKTAPSEPQVLAGLLYCRILIERNVDFVPMTRASLEAAIEKCRERCRVRIYLPFAYYDIGLFSLLLNRPYDALSAYAKAVIISDSDSQIEHELQRVIKMKKALGEKLPELEWVRKFLLAARAAKLMKMADDKKGELCSKRDSQKNLEIEKAREADPKKVNDLKKQIEETKEAVRKVKEEQKRILARLEASLEECRTECLLNKELISGDRIVLVAGGCDVRYEAKIQEYRSLFEFAFKNFDGTIFCGCTNSGVNRLVGDLPDRNGTIQKIAYKPAKKPSWARKHPAFKRLVRTIGQGFSPIDAIQNWLDLLALDIKPSDVKMVGINGGKIAAVEYRIALAMGAKVGILADSGRAASDVFHDEFWHDTLGLIRLPNDMETARLFVCGFPPCRALADHREAIAREGHEEVYRPEAIRNATKREPNLKSWEELLEDLKESNRQQVDHIEEKLRAIGLKVRYVGKGPIEPIEFSDEQAERLAEMEHGRWTVERLLAGWRLGEKDVAKKKSPYLVAWSDLPDEIKKYDYDAVRNIPYRLAKWGYEIIPEKQNGS